MGEGAGSSPEYFRAAKAMNPAITITGTAISVAISAGLSRGSPDASVSAGFGSRKFSSGASLMPASLVEPTLIGKSSAPSAHNEPVASSQ